MPNSARAGRRQRGRRSRVDPAAGEANQIDPPARGHLDHVRELAVKGTPPKRGQVVIAAPGDGALP
jgi:hypothetical protein